MTGFHKDTICRAGADTILVRMVDPCTALDSPDRYKWLSATISDEDALQFFVIADFGDFGGHETLEHARAAVADFLENEGCLGDELLDAIEHNAFRQMLVDKKRRDNLLRRAERIADLQARELKRLEQRAADLGCTVTLARHIDWLERRLALLDGVAVARET